MMCEMTQSCTVWYTLSTVVPRSRGPLHPIGASANSLNRTILTLLHSVRKTRLCGGEVPLLGDWVMGADVMWSLDDRVQVRVYAATP